ncbi:hypothetical protein [Micromonospora profundi]|uniref:hypothetical protein n=1 Tax=Micromonospora profundi TaxID=1420889 RepID=UPI003653C051
MIGWRAPGMGGRLRGDGASSNEGVVHREQVREELFGVERSGRQLMGNQDDDRSHGCAQQSKPQQQISSLEAAIAQLVDEAAGRAGWYRGSSCQVGVWAVACLVVIPVIESDVDDCGTHRPRSLCDVGAAGSRAGAEGAAQAGVPSQESVRCLAEKLRPHADWCAGHRRAVGGAPP